MFFLPIENITYKTKLSIEDIIERLHSVIEPTEMVYGKSGFSASNVHKTYKGKVEANSFKVEHIIKNKNSYNPIISGRIEKEMNASKIILKMRLNTMVLIFSTFWIGGVSLGLIHFISISSTDDILNKDVIILVLMLIFGYGSMMLGFKTESIKSKKYFALLFEAETGSKRKGIKRKRYLK